MNSEYRVNREIRAGRVRLISPAGEQIGIVSVEEALRRADENGLDLVEVAANAEPPVCRIIDYGKFRYEKMKQAKESRKRQKVIDVKEIRVRPKIGENDYQVKLRHALEFLKSGNKIKFTLMFRGREVVHKELGQNLMQRFIKDLEEAAAVEQMPVLQSRFITMVLTPR